MCFNNCSGPIGGAGQTTISKRRDNDNASTRQPVRGFSDKQNTKNCKTKRQGNRETGKQGDRESGRQRDREIETGDRRQGDKQ